MGEVTEGAIVCGGCERRFRWREELAGRAVRCPCGATMTAPAGPPGAEGDSGYDLAEERPTQRVTMARTEHSAAGGNGVVMGYQGKQVGAGEKGESVAAPPPGVPFAGDPAKDVRVPLLLLAIGTGVEVSLAMLRVRRGGTGAMGEAAAELGLGLVAGTALSLVGVLIAARVRGLDLGPMWRAVVKLGAVSVTPSAAMSLLWLPGRYIPLGFLGVWAAGFCLYFALIGAFFELDQDDKWYCVMVIFVVKVAVVLGIRFLV